MLVNASLMNLWDNERDEAIQKKRVPVVTQEAAWLEAGYLRVLPCLRLVVAPDTVRGEGEQSSLHIRM